MLLLLLLLLLLLWWLAINYWYLNTFFLIYLLIYLANYYFCNNHLLQCCSIECILNLSGWCNHRIFACTCACWILVVWSASFCNLLCGFYLCFDRFSCIVQLFLDFLDVVFNFFISWSISNDLVLVYYIFLFSWYLRMVLADTQSCNCSLSSAHCSFSNTWLSMKLYLTTILLMCILDSSLSWVNSSFFLSSCTPPWIDNNLELSRIFELRRLYLECYRSYKYPLGYTGCFVDHFVHNSASYWCFEFLDCWCLK